MAMTAVPSGYRARESGILVPIDFRAADVGQGDVSDLRTPQAWLTDTLRGYRTLAGTSISPNSALTIATYFACIRNISEDIGKLPLLTYKRLTRGKERAITHRHYDLLALRPNPAMSAMTFKETMTQFVMGWGNAYAEIVWDPYTGYAKELWPIHPSRVRITNLKDEGLVYDVRSQWAMWMGGVDPFEAIRLPAKDVLHLRGLGSEGMYGYSVAQLASESLGLTLAAENFGAAFFGNGTYMSGVLEHPQTLSDEALKHLRESWQERYQGPQNAHKPAILEEGMKWHQLGVNPDDAQFLLTREFQVEEICRWFRMPPHKVAHLKQAARAGSTLEQQNQEYVIDTLMPWAVRWEQEVDRKLFAEEYPEYFAEYLLNALMRGDVKARAAYYKTMFEIGVYSINEIREMENENAIAYGDTHFVQGNNMVPLHVIAQQSGEQEQVPADEGEYPGDFPRSYHYHNGHRNGTHQLLEEVGHAR